MEFKLKETVDKLNNLLNLDFTLEVYNSLANNSKDSEFNRMLYEYNYQGLLVDEKDKADQLIKELKSDYMLKLDDIYDYNSLKLLLDQNVLANLLQNVGCLKNIAFATPNYISKHLKSLIKDSEILKRLKSYASKVILAARVDYFKKPVYKFSLPDLKKPLSVKNNHKKIVRRGGRNARKRRKSRKNTMIQSEVESSSDEI